MKPNDQLVELRQLSAYELIERLDRAFRHRCIDPGESLESAQRFAGLRSLIDYLLMLKQEEETNDDE